MPAGRPAALGGRGGRGRMTCPRAGVKTPGPPARDTARGPHGRESPIIRSAVPTPLGRFRRRRGRVQPPRSVPCLPAGPRRSSRESAGPMNSGSPSRASMGRSGAGCRSGLSVSATRSMCGPGTDATRVGSATSLTRDERGFTSRAWTPPSRSGGPQRQGRRAARGRRRRLPRQVRALRQHHCRSHGQRRRRGHDDRAASRNSMAKRGRHGCAIHHQRRDDHP